MPRKHEVSRMTESQYKTLRRLLLLWFKVLARRKYSIFQNFLLAISLFLNIYLFMVIKDKKISILTQPINIEQALALTSYPSISNPNQTLLKRFNRLYKDYLVDKAKPDSSYYTKAKVINSDWSKSCILKLRRIIGIRTRLMDIELLLANNYPEQADKIQEIIKDTKYEDILSDMSNYYAKFISSESYDYLLKTSD